VILDYCLSGSVKLGIPTNGRGNCHTVRFVVASSTDVLLILTQRYCSGVLPGKSALSAFRTPSDDPFVRRISLPGCWKAGGRKVRHAVCPLFFLSHYGAQNSIMIFSLKWVNWDCLDRRFKATAVLGRAMWLMVSLLEKLSGLYRGFVSLLTYPCTC
jgi:hypothetical protein